MSDRGGAGAIAVLVFGKGGQVASELGRIDDPFLRVTAAGRPDADIRDASLVAAAIDRVRPGVVVNAAAYTAVDAAESNDVEAFAVNAEGPANIAKACAERGVPLIHLSTDYVFDGEKAGAYREDDPVCPLSTYGRSKERGEQCVREGAPRHVIMRTAWVYSPFGANFVKTMLRLAKERDRLGVVADQFGVPTSAKSIAQAIATVAHALARYPDENTGTYHFVDDGETSWHGFAHEIFAQVAGRGGRVPQLDAITTAQYPTPAKRPRNSVLNCEKIVSAFGVTRTPWQDSLRTCLDELWIPAETQS